WQGQVREDYGVRRQTQKLGLQRCGRRGSQEKDCSMKKAALALATRGLAVFPCWQNRKTPVCKHGFKEATTDPEMIEAWWSSYLLANIAVATGRVSGVFVVDIDEKQGRAGEADLRALEVKHGPLPATIESITPSKGRHLWFRMPEFSVLSSVG